MNAVSSSKTLPMSFFVSSVFSDNAWYTTVFVAAFAAMSGSSEGEFGEAPVTSS